MYVDEDARVYHDWESYLLNNTQPKCVLIVPENGEYNGTIIVSILNDWMKLIISG